MKFYLKPLFISDNAANQQFDDSADDVSGLLAWLCIYFANQNSNNFVISGFGQDAWPVDVRTELAIFLEQLPNSIDAVNNQDSQFEISFYEQGFERTLNFELKREKYLVSCTSFDQWQPDPAVETIDGELLMGMFIQIGEEVLKGCEQVDPSLLNHPLMREWIEKVRPVPNKKRERESF